MAVKHSILTCVILMLLGIVDPAAAGEGMTFGDGLAFFLIVSIVIVGVLACLGQYSRRVSSGRF